MDQQKYIQAVEERLSSTLNEYRFNNYKKQLAARKLSVAFNASYNEAYLWNRALFLSTNAAVLVRENGNRKLALQSFKESAEIYENLSVAGEEYDRSYCLILSSLCYDLAGYQANAYCLIKQLESLNLISQEEDLKLESDNYIFSQINLLLRKNIFLARQNLRTNNDIGESLTTTALSNWYEHILNGTNTPFQENIDNAYKYYLNAGNIYLSHVLFLIRCRFSLYIERSIWEILNGIEGISQSPIWSKYVKLLSHDFYDGNDFKENGKRISKFEFWVSQIRAIEKGLFTEESNFVIQMPTSAGKTFIAELSILNALVKNPGKKCIYVAPFRALTNEKENELATYLSKLGFSVSSLSGSYEVDLFEQLVLEDTDVLVATPEKIDLLFRLNSEYFRNISLIVVDEGHIVGDYSPRSSLLEFLIIRLKIKIPEARILFISAVMPPENANEYSLWLNNQRDKVLRSLLHADSSIEEEWEPTRKLIGRFEWSGNNGRITYKNIDTENEETQVRLDAFIPAIITKRQFLETYPDGTNKAQTSAALAYTLSNTGNSLVFCAKVADTERVAKILLSMLDLFDLLGDSIPSHFATNISTESYFFSQKWFGDESHVTQCLSRGIGIHYGDMPEPVRRAVESDFSNGKLRVLISTNTIGQGLNFPIRHLIIHSTIISFNQKIKVRDFWNIIGRAGRAGKETEGQIVFVINSFTDERSYSEYTNKSNIEPAFSMLFNCLNALSRKRISENEYETFVSALSETYLLNIIAEEIVETDDQDSIDLIINNSLFKVQAEQKAIDTAPLKASFSKMISDIKENVPDDLVKVFGQTGFSLKSNQEIVDFINSNEPDLKTIVESDNHLLLTQKILELFDSSEMSEVNSEKLQRLSLSVGSCNEILQKWITGDDINDLQRTWATISGNPQHLHVLIAEGFYYRFPWGITSFLTILCHQLRIERADLPSNISGLSSYVKYGVNNTTACLARSLGIKNRDTALLIAEKSNNRTGRDFIRWLANLTMEDINEFNVNHFDGRNVLNVALKLSPQRFISVPDEFNFNVRGITYETERMNNSLRIEVNDLLTLTREPSNPFDAYAVKISVNEHELGYVPREVAKIMAFEMDISNVKYIAQVVETTERDNYKDLSVKAIKEGLNKDF
jgi:helicase